MESCVNVLNDFGVTSDVHVCSAHRTPADAARLSKQARSKGVGAIICAAGLAAHLAGVIAAHTTLPVIGVPMPAGALAGQDALLATVQMPPGVPVATVGIGGAKNAGLLAIQILAVSDDKLTTKLVEFKKSMAEKVKKANRALRSTLRK
jgi:5-(carboxyamino)imidazole ribonucleotide mutase